TLNVAFPFVPRGMRDYELDVGILQEPDQLDGVFNPLALHNPGRLQDPDILRGQTERGTEFPAVIVRGFGSMLEIHDIRNHPAVQARPSAELLGRLGIDGHMLDLGERRWKRSPEVI